METVVDINLIFTDELPDDVTGNEILEIFKTYLNETGDLDEYDFTDTEVSLSDPVGPDETPTPDPGEQFLLFSCYYEGYISKLKRYTYQDTCNLSLYSRWG